MTRWQRDQLVEARAGAILAGARTAGAYAKHFEAQLGTAGPSPAALTVGAGSAWVADQGSDSIIRIDPRTDQVRDRTGLTGTPTSLTFTGGRVWAAIRPTAAFTGI